MITDNGANANSRLGWVIAVFEYRQAQELGEAFHHRGVKFLLLGKSAAIVLGFPDTTQDVDVFPEKSPCNGQALVQALRDLGFELSDPIAAEIERGKDFIQLKSGPFDIDLIFAPDGIDSFQVAWERHLEIQGIPVCHLDDIIASKQAANRAKDRESLPRLIAFRDYWREHHRNQTEAEETSTENH